MILRLTSQLAKRSIFTHTITAKYGALWPKFRYQSRFLVTEAASTQLETQKFAIETYGCQMNFSDSEVVNSILSQSGRFTLVPSIADADIVLLMTCAIRDHAEERIRNRIRTIKALSKSRRAEVTVGILGCMAERLKTKLLEEEEVEVVCGPDSYRDLPRLLDNASSTNYMDRINVILSKEETYADVAPVRLDRNKKSAFVSIMRGCNNMCTYCIVPFTRGRERSRPIATILNEVRRLESEGVREVTLLGQNVNSYCDSSEVTNYGSIDVAKIEMSRGFRTIYRTTSPGKRFQDLLDLLSQEFEDIRFRFTSPHPKDFPDPLLLLIRDRKNICKQIHLPAQSGSNSVLERMRRGYTRESYLELVNNIRNIVADVSLSSDFIVGFPGETEEDFKQTVELMEIVNYDMAYMYAYSLREGTAAHRRYEDNVSEAIKQLRLRTLIDRFYSNITKKLSSLVENDVLVLVEGDSKKDKDFWMGKNDFGHTIVFPKTQILDVNGQFRRAMVGEFIVVEVIGVKGSTLIGRPKEFSSIKSYQNLRSLNVPNSI